MRKWEWQIYCLSNALFNVNFQATCYINSLWTLFINCYTLNRMKERMKESINESFVANIISTWHFIVKFCFIEYSITTENLWICWKQLVFRKIWKCPIFLILTTLNVFCLWNSHLTIQLCWRQNEIRNQMSRMSNKVSYDVI